MKRFFKKLLRDDTGAISLEYGLVALLLAGGLFLVLADNSKQEVADKRQRTVTQISGWTKAVRDVYSPYTATADSATIATIIPEKDLPSDTIIDYSADTFQIALGGVLDPVLNGDNTFGLSMAFRAEDCVWILGRFKDALGTDRLASVSVNATGLAAITQASATTACNVASNTVLLTFNL